ncbi:MAG TPA: hypothetical protein VHW23_21555 [Kofleriaceae bacterium]|nr:hypothetical protein [Kofleriaceae bacterium]
MRITDARVAPVEVPSVAPVVRWRQNFGNRVFIPDDAGGFWLVDGSGEYIHLDRALHRTDPLPLRQHLRERGSLGPHIDEPEHELQLGWVLFGFPVVLVAGLAIGWTGGPRRPILRTRPTVIASIVYLVTAAWGLSRVALLL